MDGRSGVSRSMSGPKSQTPNHWTALNHMVCNLNLKVPIFFFFIEADILNLIPGYNIQCQ